LTKIERVRSPPAQDRAIFPPGRYFPPERALTRRLPRLPLPRRFPVWLRIQPEIFRGTPLGSLRRSMCWSEEAVYPRFALLQCERGSDTVVGLAAQNPWCGA